MSVGYGRRCGRGGHPWWFVMAVGIAAAALEDGDVFMATVFFGLAAWLVIR